MKKKHVLQYHPENTIRSVVIKNMKSREQMLIENIGNNILKRIPGSENCFLGGNGQIRESFEQKNNQPRPRNLASQPPHFQPQHPPPTFQPQPQPPRSGPQLTSMSPGFRPYNVQPPNHSARCQTPVYPTEQCQSTKPSPSEFPPATTVLPLWTTNYSGISYTVYQCFSSSSPGRSSTTSTPSQASCSLSRPAYWPGLPL